jgi:small basic protein
VIFILPLIGVIVGFIIVYVANITVPADFASYLSLATLSGLDAVVGGIRAGVEEKFKSDIFVSGFLVNSLLAILLAYIGEQAGVDLFLAVVVVIGGRLFLNLSLIRRYIITRISLSKKDS